MKKENFVKTIKCLLAQDEINAEFEQALEPFFDNYLVPTFNSKLQGDIISILEDEMNDKYETISWWLYDSPEAGNNKSCSYVDDGDVRIPLETPEQLYDFLKEDNG